MKPIPLGHPRQCQHVCGNHFCLSMAEEGSRFCLNHGGNQASRKDKKERMRNYILGKFQARAEQLGNSQDILSLRDEVAILRMLIEQRIVKCQDESDLLLVSGPLSDLVMKSEKLVSSMYKLEDRMNKHLDKAKVVQLAQVLIDIISKYVENPEILDAISADFQKALEEI